MLCIWSFFLESKAFQKHWVIFQIDLWGYYMIIQHFTDERARGPQKPTEAKPLSVSNFSWDGKRTDISWPLTIMLDPGLEIPHALRYQTLKQSQGVIIHFLQTAEFFSTQRQNNWPRSHS